MMKNRTVPTCSAAGEQNHNKKSATICYVGGRSGGHIVPALTHAHNHLAQKPDDKILFVATNTPLDGALVGAATHVHTKLYLKLPNVPRRLFAIPSFACRFGIAFIKSFRMLRSKRVARVVSMGGYVSLPVCFAARLLRIPITLFELNVHPGRATSFLAPHVTEVAVCFESAKTAFSRNVTLASYPLQYQAKPSEQALIDHKRLQGLETGKKVVLVLGGSQGSVFLNGLIGQWLDAMPSARDRVHVVHQTGANDPCDWAAWYHERGIAATVFPYSNDLSLWYSCADLVVCRAGAGTLFEVAFFQKPCVIIPLVTAETAHQVDNAKAMVAQSPGQFAMLNQADIQGNPELFFERMAHELQR